MTVSREDFEQLAREHRVLLGQYGRVQARCSQQIAELAEDRRRLQAQVMRLRAAVMVRDTALACAREDQAALQAAIPGLPTRRALARHVEALLARIQALMRERLGWQGSASPVKAPPAQTGMPADLRQKAVLCVGPDQAGATAAQRVVEMAGGHYLHHDGGDLENGAALEASLVAADLVICQTGCVSHNAYWRVQDHCRRTGKQCVLVAQPMALQVMRLHRAPPSVSPPGPSPAPLAHHEDLQP